MGRWRAGFHVSCQNVGGGGLIPNSRFQIQETETSRLSVSGLGDCSIRPRLDCITARVFGFHGFMSSPFRLVDFSTSELSTLDSRLKNRTTIRRTRRNRRAASHRVAPVL